MKDFKQNSATGSDAQVPTMCFVCQKPIVDSAWFCRLPKKAEGAAASPVAEIFLCSSVCALRHFGDSQPYGNGFEPSYDGFEHSPHVPEDQRTSKAESAPKTRTKQ